MARVKRGTKRRARRKKYLKRTKGFFLTKSKLYQSAQEAANRADRYAKRDRRVKKREYRKLWIQRLGAAARNNGLTYGQLIHGLKVAGVNLDRKVLADIAGGDSESRRPAASQGEKGVAARRLFFVGAQHAAPLSARCTRLGESLSPVIPSAARNLSSSLAQRRLLCRRAQNFFRRGTINRAPRCNLSRDYA